MEAPSSSYSSALTHIFLKVVKVAKIEPPIQVEYLRSGGADILIFISLGANIFISFNNLKKVLNLQIKLY
jgi:hypothetical protein